MTQSVAKGFYFGISLKINPLPKNEAITIAPPLVAEVKRALLEHLQDHYGLYGELTGVRSARKHIGWYVRGLPGGDEFRDHMNTLETAELQSLAVADFFEAMASRMERMPKAVLGLTPEMVLETME